MVSRLWKEHRSLLALLAVSWLLRIALCLRGGQFFISDEHRFPQAFRIIYDAASGHWLAALDTVLEIPHHVAFPLLSLPIALLHSVLILALRLPPRWESFVGTIYVSACLLSLCSVASIALTYALALRLNAGRREALTAASLMAGSNSMFFFSRHLFPYDMSMALCLLGLWVGLDEEPSFRRSLLCGTILGLAFMAYHGYWPFVAVLCAAHVLYGRPSFSAAARRVLALGLTGPALMVSLTLVSLLRGSTPYFQIVRHFMHEAHDFGDPSFFAEGWRLPWAFFWSAEHGLLAVWIAGTAAAVRLSIKAGGPKRGLVWSGIAAGIYALLVVSSSLLHMFPVYGRFSKEMVPFLCLAAACGIEGLAGPRLENRTFASLAAALLAVQAGFNFAAPYRQRFPEEVRRELAAKYGRLAEAETIDQGAAVPPDDKSLPYILVDARNFWPILGTFPAPAGKVLYETPHPLTYWPYQYEGYKPAERAILRSADLSIRLVARPASSHL